MAETFVRGYIDWVVDVDGPVAKLADLKTANPNLDGAGLTTKLTLQVAGDGIQLSDR